MTEKNLELIDIRRFSPVDLDNVIDSCMKYNGLMNLHTNLLNETDMWLVVQHLQIARLHFSKAKNLLSSMLKQEDNPYIKEASKQHDWLVNDLGRVEKNITLVEKEFFNMNITLENGILQTKANNVVRVNSFYNFIREVMESIVINPIKVAYKNYKLTEKKIEADTEHKLDLKKTKQKLFVYWIFLEVYHNSLYTGGLTREEAPRNVGKGVQMFESPRTIPKGITITEEDLSEETAEKIIDPFKEEEDD